MTVDAVFHLYKTGRVRGELRGGGNVVNDVHVPFFELQEEIAVAAKQDLSFPRQRKAGTIGARRYRIEAEQKSSQLFGGTALPVRDASDFIEDFRKKILINGQAGRSKVSCFFGKRKGNLREE